MKGERFEDFRDIAKASTSSGSEHVQPSTSSGNKSIQPGVSDATKRRKIAKEKAETDNQINLPDFNVETDENITNSVDLDLVKD